MTLRTLGSLTLQISFGLYLCMIATQIFHNIKRRSITGLSWIMHVVLLSSYVCDIGYALGTYMPWQYYSISLAGAGMLSIQHFQFWRYRTGRAPRSYFYVTSGLLVLLVIILSRLAHRAAHQQLFTLLGFVSVLGWNGADLPQLFVNRRLRSTAGLALPYVLLGILGISCDILTAYGLNWGLPNKIGAPVSLCLKLTLLAQFWLYRQSPSSAKPVGRDSTFAQLAPRA